MIRPPGHAHASGDFRDAAITIDGLEEALLLAIGDTVVLAACCVASTEVETLSFHRHESCPRKHPLNI